MKSPPRNGKVPPPEKYRVRGEETEYEDFVEALRSARKKGPGTEVESCPGRVLMATVPSGKHSV